MYWASGEPGPSGEPGDRRIGGQRDDGAAAEARRFRRAQVEGGREQAGRRAEIDALGAHEPRPERDHVHAVVAQLADPKSIRGVAVTGCDLDDTAFPDLRAAGGAPPRPAAPGGAVPS